jgi:hypothetical protein
MSKQEPLHTPFARRGSVLYPYTEERYYFYHDDQEEPPVVGTYKRRALPWQTPQEVYVTTGGEKIYPNGDAGKQRSEALRELAECAPAIAELCLRYFAEDPLYVSPYKAPVPVLSPKLATE